MRGPTTTAILIMSALPWLASCDVDVEEPGKMPSVDVEGETGNMPEYEVTKTEKGKMPSVDVDAQPGEMPEVDVRGPEVDVGTEPVTVPVPDIDVDMPDDRNASGSSQSSN